MRNKSCSSCEWFVKTRTTMSGYKTNWEKRWELLEKDLRRILIRLPKPPKTVVKE